MITKLTKEQQDLIPVYLNKWLEISHRTKIIDIEKSKTAVDFLYRDILGKSLPKHYLNLSSPVMVNLAINILQMNEQEFSKYSSDFYLNSTNNNTSLTRSTIEFFLSWRSKEKYQPFGLQINSSLFKSRMYSNLHTHLDLQIDSQLHQELSLTVCKNQYSLNTSLCKMNCYSDTTSALCDDSAWFFDFLLNEIFPEKKEDFTVFIKYLEHLKEFHMVHMFDNVALICDFPEKFSNNDSFNNITLLYRDSELVDFNRIK